MCRVLLIALGVLVAVAAQTAFAQQQCTLWVGNGGQTYSDASGACSSYSSNYETNGPGSDTVVYIVTVGTVTGNSATCNYTSTTNCNSYHASQNLPYCGQTTTGQQNGVGTIQGPCPVTPCTAKSGTVVDTVVESGPQASGSIVYDAQGCAMTINSSPVNIVGCHGGCSVQTATYTGAQQDGGTPESQAGSNCVSSSGGTFCSEDQNGKNCGTFNGDEVCPQSLPPGTCQSYASGGIACTASGTGGTTVPTPPGPDNGTAGQAATPTGQVQAPVTAAGQTTEATTNYYSAAVVQASAGGVASAGGGANVGSAGGTSGGTSGGSTPNAANGDCGASGVNCPGDSTVPTLPDEPTIGQSTQTYATSLSQVPIVAAVAGIAGAVPAGECPTATFSLFGHEFVMDAQCTLWADLTPVLSAVFLAMWSFCGVRILMSA